jgi:hypothetical protein
MEEPYCARIVCLGTQSFGYQPLNLFLFPSFFFPAAQEPFVWYTKPKILLVVHSGAWSCAKTGNRQSIVLLELLLLHIMSWLKSIAMETILHVNDQLQTWKRWAWHWHVPLLCREAIVAPFVGRHWLSPFLAVLCFTFVQFKILSWGLSPTVPNFTVYGTQWMQLKTVVSSQLVSICCFKHHYGVSVMFSSYIAVSKVPN